MLFVDGIDVRDRPLDELRASMTVVSQEPFLFSDTVAGNIRFGRRDEADGADREDADEIADADVRAAAALAAIDADVAAFPKGYATLVGERGITLSGGQKQRVALARSILADARILVLDDSLSAVDTSTEDAILRGLRQVRRSRTVVIVAHRVSTVRDADLILVFAGGRVVERGTHHQLVARGGLYAEMDRRQQLEDELSRESTR
jgi:ATP-binding cassette subfamily B protein